MVLYYFTALWSYNSVYFGIFPNFMLMLTAFANLQRKEGKQRGWERGKGLSATTFLTSVLFIASIFFIFNLQQPYHLKFISGFVL